MVPGIYKKPWIIIAICFAITAFFATQLPKLRVENDIREWLSSENPSTKRLNQSDADFGSTRLIGIAFETEKPSILTADYISTIATVSARIENLNGVDEVTSLGNVDYVCSEDGSLSSFPLIPEELFEVTYEDVPKTDEYGNVIYDQNGEVEEYIRQVKSRKFIGSNKDIDEVMHKLSEWNDMYDRVILSDDGKASQMSVVVKSLYSNGTKVSINDQLKVLDMVQNIIKEELTVSDLKLTIYGDPVTTSNSKSYMLSDLLCLIPIVVIVVVVCLFFSFKTADGTLLPLLTVLMCATWSCGLMAMLNIQFTLIASVIPVALIAVGSAYGIHVLTHYYVALDQVSQPITKELHWEAVLEGVKDVLPAVLLAGLTTIVGFISLISSPLVPLHSFAIFSSMGVAVALILSITLIPALLMVKPLNKVGMKASIKGTKLGEVKEKLKQLKVINKHFRSDGDSTYYRIYKSLVGTKPRFVLFCIAICLFSFFGIKKLVIDTALINYFPENSKLRQDVRYVNDRFAGTNSIFILVSGKEMPEQNVDEQVVSDEMPDFDDLSFDEVPSFDDIGFDDVGFDDVAISETIENDDFSSVAKTIEPKKSFYPVTDTRLLSAIEALQENLAENFPEVGKTVSFTTFVKRMNQVMKAPEEGSASEFKHNGDVLCIPTDFIDILNNAYISAGGRNATVASVMDELKKSCNYNGAAYYEIPCDMEKYDVTSEKALSDMVSQYLLLLGGDTLNRFAIPQGSPEPYGLRLQIQLRTHSTDKVSEVIDYAREYVKNNFPDNFNVEFTGGAEMESVMTQMVISSQISSLLISLLSVFIIIAISFKSGWAGLLGAIPLAFTILLNYMVMGYAGINLDLITSIIASVAVGVGIDYTIHFLEIYKSERAKTDDIELVAKRTFNKSGHGIVTNALAVGLGFLVLCFSKFIVLRYIGILIAIVMFSSSLLAMTIIPAVLCQYDPKFIRPKNSRRHSISDIEAEKEAHN